MPAGPPAAVVVPPPIVASALPPPELVVGAPPTQTPTAHDCDVEQTVHARPASPHAVGEEPLWQAPVASQQPAHVEAQSARFGAWPQAAQSRRKRSVVSRRSGDMPLEWGHTAGILRRFIGHAVVARFRRQYAGLKMQGLSST